MNYNKITEGNAFALCIRQAKWRSIGGVITPLQTSELLDIHLYVGQGGSKASATEYMVTADGDTISAVMPATLKRGVYRTWLTAIYNGREVASNCDAAFEIVAFDEHYQAYAPERVDAPTAVYLQPADVTDEDLEQLKAEFREKNAALDVAKAEAEQARQEYIAKAEALESAASREDIAALAALVAKEETAESIKQDTSMLDSVAKEDTQQEIKKTLDLVKAEISVEDKLNIRAAIELKGGKSVYKNPENPALLELAKNVGTIPQKFLTLEPEGVRYDDPIEWHAFNKDVADAVDAARALQNRIDEEDGIASILNTDVRYRGFILIDALKLIKYDSTYNRDYINLSYLQADAFLIGYNDSEKTLVEKTDSEEIKFFLQLAKFSDSQNVYIVYLYKDDDFTARLSFSGFFVKTMIIGGHPISLYFNDVIINSLIQLNVTDNTSIEFLNRESSLIYLYTRCKSGYSLIHNVRFVYAEQLEYLNSNITYNNCLSMYAPNFRSFSKVKDGVVSATYILEGPAVIYAPNLLYGGPMNGAYYINLPIRYVYASLIGFKSPSYINLPYLEEIVGGYADINESTCISNSNRLSYLNVPKLKKITFPGYGAILRECKLIDKIELPELTYIETKWQVIVTEKCERLTEIILPKLSYFVTRSHGGKECIKGSPLLKKIILGNINSNVTWGCIGATDLIHFEFTETLEYSINMTNWRPTNAINDTISTLVEDGEEFANNREKFLWNFRNYIIAMLHDYAGTGETRTLTLHSMVANVLTNEDKEAITNKGWILSIV